MPRSLLKSKQGWGGLKRPLFQNHAVSICEDIFGNFITYDEAHFICGILNTPVVCDYMLSSSDARSFPIRPRVYIPKYNKENTIHNMISDLSKEAHQYYNNLELLERIKTNLNSLYLKLVKEDRINL